ncbi:MAG: glycosyltransferase 87 family protein [Ktedonobacterales bacterium]
MAGPIFPFTYPPFTLFLFRPLAFLSFDASRVVWTIAQIALVFGAALLFADAFNSLMRRTNSGMSEKLSAVLRLTEAHIGLFRLPTLPFAIACATLGILLTPASVPYWGVLTIVSMFLLALTVAAYMRGAHWLSGLSVGLMSGFSLWQPLPGVSGLVCAVVLTFAVVGAWRVVAVAASTAVVVFALSLIIVPPMDFTLVSSQQIFLNGVYASSPHNTSLNGLVASGLAVLEHTSTANLLKGVRVARILSIAVAAVAAAVMVVLVPMVFVRWKRHSALSPESLWLVLAFALTIPLLVPTVVWPTENLLIAVSGFLLLGWSLTAAAPRIWRAVGVLGAVAASALAVVAALSGSDWRYLPQGSVTVYCTRYAR